MMEHYVTLFDSLFLPQGLALHMSMERHVNNYILWIICVDDQVHEDLSKLNLANVNLLQLSKLETAELLRVKPARTKAEYCWTLTPFAPRFVFEADSTVPRVTYIDADIWFRKNPIPIFNEFQSSGKSVLITDHAYSAENDMSALAGQYCVQFMIFNRNAEVVRKWWEDRCIEWCFSYFEEGKFGDQKYLDDWPERFPEFVHVLTNKELMLAPWNATRYPYGNSVIWHFHSLRIVSKESQKLQVYTGDYALPRCTHKYIYKPYIKDLQEAKVRLFEIGVNVKQQKKSKLQTLKYLFCLK
jgi:hypothetical protein